MPRASTKKEVSSARPVRASSTRLDKLKHVPPKNVADDPSPRGLWFCNWKIWLEARRLLDEALQPLGLRSREFWLLVIAGAGNVSQHELAELCGLDPSSLVAVLDGMERRGLLHRQRNPDDRRVQWVQRTVDGDKLYARALPRAQRAEAQQLAALSPGDQRQLVAAMQKLIVISK
jgi:DNA-binding MarR family transcriptional regulator